MRQQVAVAEHGPTQSLGCPDLVTRAVEGKAVADSELRLTDVVAEFLIEPSKGCQRPLVIAEQHVVGRDVVAAPAAVVIVAEFLLLFFELPLLAPKARANPLLFGLRHLVLDLPSRPIVAEGSSCLRMG